MFMVMMNGDSSVFDAPAYSTMQASHYVGVPYATLRDWMRPSGLISAPQPHNLSFNNLAEAHILKAMRRKHKLSLQSIRKALKQLSKLRQTAHPLLDECFVTDGISLCISEENQIINLTQKLQTEIKEFADIYLQRIERDASGRAFRLYPFIARGDGASEPRHISISPMVSFGRPVLAGTGITTAIVAGRFASRDSVSDLAREYSVEQQVLEDAIRWEMLRGKAA
jgi:uncharacterized protein (DUF433 family)/DNA-binding transcriptional MerR regulator